MLWNNNQAIDAGHHASHAGVIAYGPAGMSSEVGHARARQAGDDAGNTTAAQTPGAGPSSSTEMTNKGVEDCVCAHVRAGEGAGICADEDSETAADRVILATKALAVQRVRVEPLRHGSNSCLYFIFAAFQYARGYHATKTGLREQLADWYCVPLNRSRLSPFLTAE